MNNQLKNVITTSLIRLCLHFLICFIALNANLHANEPSANIECPTHVGFSVGYMTGKAMQLSLPRVETLSPRESDEAEFREDGLQFSLHVNSNRFFPKNSPPNPTRWFITLSYAALDIQFGSYEEADDYLNNFEKSFDLFIGIQKNLWGSKSWEPFIEAGLGYRYEDALHSEFYRTDDWPWGPQSVIASGASSSGQGLIFGFGGGYYFYQNNSPNRLCIGVHGMVGPRSEGISNYINDLAYLVRFQIYARYEIGIKL